MAKEGVKISDKNNEILHSILSDITSTRSVLELLHIIFEKVALIIDFDDVGLFHVLEDGRHRDLAVETGTNYGANPRIKQELGSEWLEPESSLDAILDKIHIHSLSDYFSHYPEHPHLEFLKKEELKQFISCPLKRNGETFGVFMLWSKIENRYSKKDIPFFSKIAVYIAIALSNILDREELLKEKQFKETLLNISNIVSETQDRGKLLNIIFNQLKPIFNFCDTGLFVISEDGLEVTDWCVFDKEVDPSKSNTLLRDNDFATMTYPDSALEWAINDMVDKDDAVIYDYEALRNRFPQWPHFSIMLDQDIKECISVVLRNGGKIIGMLNFNANRVGHFGANHLSLFKAIAEQLSVAVSNIIAKEQLVQEKNFKETLLAISESVASIQDRKELFKVIFEKINPIIPIDDVGILILDESGTQWKDWAVLDNYHDTDSNDTLHRTGLIDFLPLDSLTKLSLKETCIRNITNLKKDHSDNTFVEIMAQSGLKEFLFTPLKVGNKTIGAIFFDSRKEGVYHLGQFPLFKAIADQLAVAVSNVLANEELLEEKNFKEILLAISESVASIQDRKELFKVIFEKINPIIPIDDVGLLILDETGTKWKDLAVLDNYHQTRGGKELAALGFTEFLPLDKLTRLGIEQTGIISIEEMIENYSDNPFVPIMAKDLKEFLYTPLKVGNSTIGSIFLDSEKSGVYNESQLPLFKAIADQLAVAVSNVLANERLQEEKDFSNTLLGITEAVAQVNDGDDLYKTIFKNIKPVFPYDEFGLFIINEYKDEHYELITADDMHNSKAQKLVEDKLAIKSIYRHKGTSVAWMANNGPVCIAISDLDKKASHPQHKYMLEGGLRHLIGGPLTVAGKKFGILCFTSYQDDFYKDEHLILFKSIAEQISIAVSNILTNQKIIEREKEKSILLGITSGVSKIRSLPDFLSFVTKKLKPIFNFYDIGVFLLRENGEYNVDLAAIDLKISPSVGNETFYISKEKLVNHKGSLIEWMMDEIEKVGGPYLFDFVDLVERFPNYYQFELLDIVKEGYRDCLAANLKIGDSIFGMFCINAMEKNFFKQEQFSMFQNVTEQLSVAISNILANEELLREKMLKETLLEVSEAVNSIRKRKELYDTIITILRPHLGFADAVLCLVDDEKGTHIHPHTAAPESTIVHPLYKELVEKHLETKGSPMEAVLLGDDVNEMLLVDWLKRYPTYPGFLLMKDVGLQYSFTLKLKSQDNNIGILFFHFTEPQVLDDFKIKLYSNLRNQISIALSNILAQESLENEKDFSDTLLEITEALAAADDAIHLYDAINTVVKKLIPFDQVGVLILDKSEEYHYELINENFVNQISNSNKKTAPLEKQTLYKHKGTSVEWLAKNGPVITKMDYLVKNTKHPRHPDMVNAGIKELLGGPIINQGKPIGMLAFKLKKEGVFNEQHIKHYKSVAEQVSICVANILSKKEILWKSSVQNLELKVSNILTDDDITVDKWGYILQEFKQYIPFSFAMVMKIDDGKIKRYLYDWITPNEKRQLTLENLAEITKLTKKDIEKAEQALYQISTNTTDFINTKKGLPTAVKSLMSALGLNAFLPFHIAVKKKNTEIVPLLFSKQKEQYSIRHISILNGTRNTLRISLENMLSSFDIKQMSEQLKQEKTYLESVVKEAYNFEHMIGDSEAIRDVFNQITEVAGVNATTLLLGETGTGKELIARAIHENSDRKDRVLVKVNCAAIPSQIVESELFGHKKGAFTGAIQDRVGKFELANNGTIFLDEIGEMPLELQTKLLRVIQEREVERLGSNEIIKLNIRIIAATNKDLLKEIESGKFRADLYYRLNSFPIIVPPLKARDGDVLLLSDYFARQFSERYGLPFKGFTANSLSRLKRYDWPGNVRELQNLMEQAIISQRGKVLEVYPGATGASNLTWSENTGNNTSNFVFPENFDMDTIKNEKDKLERAYILQALEKTNWRVSGKNGAARLLDVASTTLESKMKKLGIERNTL